MSCEAILSIIIDFLNGLWRDTEQPNCRLRFEPRSSRIWSRVLPYGPPCSIYISGAVW